MNKPPDKPADTDPHEPPPGKPTAGKMLPVDEKAQEQAAHDREGAGGYT